MTVTTTGAPIGRTPALGFVGGFNSTEAAGQTVILGVIKFVTKFVFRQRRPLTADPFLDQTLLYEMDGRQYMTKLDPSKVAMIVDHFSLHDEPQEVQPEKSIVEEKPILPASSAELTKSKFLSLFSEEL